MEKILIAEDEKELAKALKTILEYSNYKVDTVYNGEEAVEKTKQDAYDVIILDIMMPVMDGLMALQEIRKMGINTPIILLTAKAQVDDKVEGLDAGANDYLTKPFDKDELLARIRAFTRTNNEKKEKYNIGNIIFNKENSEISNSKASLHLNSKECAIMEVLIKNQERNISSEELSKKIWQSNENQEEAVTMYISYLQDKFSALGANVQINSTNNQYIIESNTNIL